MDQAIVTRLAQLDEQFRAQRQAMTEAELIHRLRQGRTLTGEPFQQSPRLIDLRPYGPGLHIPAHTRDFVELVYMCRGTSTHQILNKTIYLQEGQLLLLGQNTQQEMLPLDRDALAVSFLIKPVFLSEILRFLGSEETPLREFLLRCLGQETPYGYLHFRAEEIKPVQNLVENLLRHILDSRDSRRRIPAHTMGLLFLHLLDETDKLTIGMKEQQSVLRVLQYIEINYVQCSLTHAAQMLHSDVAWLSREIKRRTGRTFTELVQERRLNQAAWLLRNTGQKVADIAVSVGYENISYFHRIFAARFGTSPKKYRDGV